jgi:hypothetical protein
MQKAKVTAPWECQAWRDRALANSSSDANLRTTAFSVGYSQKRAAKVGHQQMTRHQASPDS